MKFCNQLPNFKNISEVSKFDEPECNDVDYNLANCISNKYYPVGEVQKLNTSKHSNVFHSNVN